MSYNRAKLGTSFLFSTIVLAFLIYLISSSMVAMSLMPALGAGGLYAQVDSIEGDVGTVYPEYQGDGTGFGNLDGTGRADYAVPITTTVPSCGDDGIPMLVVELDGQARADGFSFRKDVRLPFINDRWMVIQINDVTISGSNLKIFTTQLAGQFLRIRNARVVEGGIEDPNIESDDTWGPDSSQFVIQGGQDTRPNIPGLEGQDIQAWIHGATGERITLEADEGGFVNVDISYNTTNQVMGFYDGTAPGEDAKLGFDLQDENIDFGGGDRIQRGIVPGFGEPADDDGYFTCSDLGQVGS